jgi:hypothetical protein
MDWLALISTDTDLADADDDIGFVEALHRIMSLAVEQLRQMGTFCEKTAATFFDTVMAAALKYVNFSKGRMMTNNC